MRVLNTWVGHGLAALLAATTATAACAQTAAPPADSWLTFMGDAQHTNSRAVKLGLPVNLLWRHTTTSAPGDFVTTPLVDGTAAQRRVYFSTGDAIYCIESSTGEQIWHSSMSEGHIVTPVTMIRNGNENLIMGMTDQDNIIAVRASNGTQAWSYAAKAQPGLPAIVRTPRGDRIVLASGDGRMGAITTQGQEDPEWSVRIGRRIADPTSTPTVSVDGKRLFVTTRDRKVYAIDAATGAVGFSFELDAISEMSPLVVQDQVIIVARTIMSAHSVADGKRLWNVDLRDGLLAPPAALSSDGRSTIYVGSRNGTLSALDATTGKVAWSVNLEASITTTPTVLSDVILVGTSTGMLIGVRPADGAVLWQYRLHSVRTTVAQPPADVATDGVPSVEAHAQFGAGGSQPGTLPPAAPATTFPPAGGTAPPVVDLGPPLVTLTYGISATPVVVDGKLYVLGNNASFYAFDASAIDVLGPRAVAPSLSIPNTQGQLTPSLVDGAAPPAVPGQAPIYFAVELADTGSGVNASSIKVTLNNKDIPAQNVYFQRSSGILTITLAEKVPLNKGNLQDGQLTLTITARDYRNNEMTYSASIMIDNSLPAPSPPQPVAPPVAPVTPGGFGGGFGGRM